MQINLNIITATLTQMKLSSRIFILNSEETRRTGVTVGRDSGALYMHVDDIGVASSSQSFSDRVVEGLVRGFRQAGFVVTSSLGSLVTRYVG